MAELKFTREDRVLLRSYRIDSEPTITEMMFDIIHTPPQYLPHAIYISQETARLVIKEYGELTVENYWAYRAKFD